MTDSTNPAAAQRTCPQCGSSDRKEYVLPKCNPRVSWVLGGENNKPHPWHDTPSEPVSPQEASRPDERRFCINCGVREDAMNPEALCIGTTRSDRAYPTLVVCALIVRDEKVLLERRAPTGVAGLDRMFDLPGGKVENGESPENAIVRELQEELNITVKPVAMIPELKQSAWDYGKGVRYWILVTYCCQIITGEPKCGENLKWLLLSEINEQNTLAADLDIVRRYACGATPELLEAKREKI